MSTRRIWSRHACSRRSTVRIGWPSRRAIELPFGPGKPLLNSTHGVVSRLVGGWQFLANTVFQSGSPMGVPGNVWVIGDPKIENPTWDRLFKTGYIDATGVVRNVLPGEQPVFWGRGPNTLQTTPARWGHIRNQWATTYDMSMIKNTRIKEGINTQFRFEAFNATEHAGVLGRSEQYADLDQLRQDHPRQRPEQCAAESSSSDSV